MDTLVIVVAEWCKIIITNLNAVQISLVQTKSCHIDTAVLDLFYSVKRKLLNKARMERRIFVNSDKLSLPLLSHLAGLKEADIALCSIILIICNFNIEIIPCSGLRLYINTFPSPVKIVVFLTPENLRKVRLSADNYLRVHLIFAGCRSHFPAALDFRVREPYRIFNSIYLYINDFHTDFSLIKYDNKARHDSLISRPYMPPNLICQVLFSAERINGAYPLKFAPAKDFIYH